MPEAGQVCPGPSVLSAHLGLLTAPREAPTWRVEGGYGREGGTENTGVSILSGAKSPWEVPQGPACPHTPPSLGSAVSRAPF